MTPTTRPWWDTARHEDRRPFLLARNRIKSALRRWFEDQGFVEVDTACLQISPGNEAHLHAFKTDYETEAGARSPYYLHTSPEFACKKLLAAGETKIFTFAPCFRNGERGRLHSPEFTMLEWYRAGAPYDQLKDDCVKILRLAAETSGLAEWMFNGLHADPKLAPERRTVDSAFTEYADIRLLDDTLRDGVPDRDALAREARRIGLRVAEDDTWSDIFSRILVQEIEPRIGRMSENDTEPQPAFILDEYPTHEAALARRCAHDPRVAERFELYCCGVELANAFGELTDAGEQRRRFEAEMVEKQRVYGRRYPIDEDFLAALEQMPAASGCALGFDRLVMLATGATDIEQVLWTPVA